MSRGNSLQKARFVKNVLPCPQSRQGVVVMPARPSIGRIVKRGASGAADGHEREKNLLAEGEITALLQAAKAGRHGVRDHLLVLMMYRHGMRVSETVDLRRNEVDLDRSHLWVRRLKNGLSVEQPIPGDDLRLIQDYLGHRDPKHTVHYTRVAGYRFEGLWRP